MGVLNDGSTPPRSLLLSNFLEGALLYVPLHLYIVRLYFTFLHELLLYILLNAGDLIPVNSN